MAKASVQRTIQCYHCRHQFEVSVQTMSTACPKCYKAIRLEDLIVKVHHAVRKIQTCGRVVVHRKGKVVAQFIEAHGGVEIEGILEGDVLSGSTVRIGAKAQWKGGCRAPSVSIEDGAVISGGYFVVPDQTAVIKPQAPAASVTPEAIARASNDDDDRSASDTDGADD